MTNRILEIRTHDAHSIDEWVAHFLLEMFGGDKFELSQDCKVAVDTTTDVSDPHKERILIQKGVLYLGTGGGMFDEHPCFGANRKARIENECCATLVAKYLGVDKDPALQYIIQLALNDDLGIGPDKNDAPGRLLAHFSLPKMIKTMYANNSLDHDRMKDIIFTFLCEVYEDQKTFFSAKAIVEKGRVEKLRLPNNRTYTMLVVETNHRKVQDYAWSTTYHQLVLKISPNGNWQLFTRRGSPLFHYLPCIVGMIRIRESKLTGGAVRRNDLMAEGSVPGAMRINYFACAGLISNGTLTHNVAPSAINPREIPGIIRTALTAATARAKANVTKSLDDVTDDDVFESAVNLVAMETTGMAAS